MPTTAEFTTVAGAVRRRSYSVRRQYPYRNEGYENYFIIFREGYGVIASLHKNELNAIQQEIVKALMPRA